MGSGMGFEWDDEPDIVEGPARADKNAHDAYELQKMKTEQRKETVKKLKESTKVEKPTKVKR